MEIERSGLLFYERGIAACKFSWANSPGGRLCPRLQDCQNFASGLDFHPCFIATLEAATLIL